jgi:hypothetical protein
VLTAHAHTARATGAPGHATATGYRAPSWHRGPPGDAGYPARHAADPAPGQAVSRELLGDDLGLIDALQERIDRLDWEIASGRGPARRFLAGLAGHLNCSAGQRGEPCCARQEDRAKLLRPEKGDG